MSTVLLGFNHSLVANVRANSCVEQPKKSRLLTIFNAVISNPVVRYARTTLAGRKQRIARESVHLNGVDTYVVDFLRRQLSSTENIFSDLYSLYEASDNLDREIEIIFRITEDNFASNRFDRVDSVLGCAVTEYLSPLAIEGLLRTTYRFKQVLPNWEVLLKRAEHTLSDAGVDVDVLLAGMRK